MSIKIKKILISQPEPTSEKSPYSELAEKYGLKFDFHQFIQVEGVSAKEFRNQRINILDHFAVVFTSKTGVDNFFRIAEEFKVPIPETMKYFCISDSVAFYLQKYIIYRKRKIFYAATGLFKDLITIMSKQRPDGGRFLLVLSDVYKAEIPQLMDKSKFKYTKGIFYKTVSRNLSNIDIKSYDVLAFFSPQGIKSLFYNFPNFKQNKTIIAAFGPTTAKAIKDAGLTLNIPVPTPEALSMPSALELYIKQQSKSAKDVKVEKVDKQAKKAVEVEKEPIKLPEQPAKKSADMKVVIKPAVKPAAKATKSTAKPDAKLVKSVAKATKSTPKPVKSPVKPAKPAPKSSAKPAKAVAKSAPKSTKPATKVVKTAVKPAKPAVKTTKSATKSAKPATKVVKPAAKPAKPVTKSATKPAKPAAKSAKSVAKTSKSATKPAKPAVKSAKSAKKSAK